MTRSASRTPDSADGTATPTAKCGEWQAAVADAERPRQVTMAGWLIMVGSAFALGLVVQRLSGCTPWRTCSGSTDPREPPGSELGSAPTRCSPRSARSRWSPRAAPPPPASWATTCCGAAGARDGGHRARRAPLPRRHGHRRVHHLGRRRVGRDPVAAAGPVLVRRQARRPSVVRRPRPPPLAPPVPAPFATHLTGAQAPDAAPGRRRAGRPAAVLWACVLTWVCTAFVTLGLVASAVALAVSPDLMLDQVHKDNPDLAAQGISDDLLLVATYVMIAGSSCGASRRRPRRPGPPPGRLGPDRADRLRGHCAVLCLVGTPSAPSCRVPAPRERSPS